MDIVSAVCVGQEVVAVARHSGSVRLAGAGWRSQSQSHGRSRWASSPPPAQAAPTTDTPHITGLRRSEIQQELQMDPLASPHLPWDQPCV